MNGKMQEEIDQILRESGAVVKCPICRNYDILSDDEAFERRAYAMATVAAKKGVFRDTSIDQAQLAVSQALRSASAKCPSCDKEDNS